MKKNSLSEPVKVLKVRYWYEGVRLRTGEQSAYGLEKRFEPQKINKDGDKQAPPKKWPRYKSGKVVPCREMVTAIEKAVPGSLKELNSPLWKILLVEKMTIRRVERYIDLLEPNVRKSMHRWRKAKVDGTRNNVWYGQGRALVRKGSLDALAALVLMWEIYRYEGRYEDMRTLAELIYKCMLIAGESFWHRGVATEFFEVFNAKVFSRTIWENGKCELDTEVFEHGISMLNDALSNVVDEGALQSSDDIHRVKQRLMYGEKGFDCRFGFSIPVVPEWMDGPPTRSQYQHGMIRLLQWLWGWTHLRTQTMGRFPLDDLWLHLSEQMGMDRLGRT
ncbi:hypothetical protein LH428_13610 [Laribacter hongkongensis]|uniref:hypothetical protein n=1 Tax=Laribacter hongkongensis TaxID=168471 RepID=UPI001EFD277B|nr:hypothetical protein [Laribacter hongkongensis]MCG9116867.1 hypothetical protein [Laribacter hongkongensis]